MKTTEERFWEKVDVNGPIPDHRPDLGNCHLWTGHVTKKGYGRFSFNGQPRPAHQFLLGEIPEGFEPDHLCLVRHCVRKTHIEIVTHVVNMERSGPATKTHCSRGHAFTAENTHVNRKGHRICRTCRNRRASISHARK